MSDVGRYAGTVNTHAQLGLPATALGTTPVAGVQSPTGLNGLYQTDLPQSRKHQMSPKDLYVHEVQNVFRDCMTISPKQKEDIAKFNKGGKRNPPITEQTVLGASQEIGAVMASGLPKKQREKAIGKIREKYKLSKKETRALVTKPMGERIEKAGKNIEGVRKEKTEALKTQLRDAEKTHGKKSPQAEALRAQIKATDAAYKPGEDTLKGLGKELKNLYKPKSFWQKLGGAFKSVFKGIGKVLGGIVNVALWPLKQIPIVGGIVDSLHNAGKRLFKGDLFGAFGYTMNAVPGIGSISTPLLLNSDKGKKWVQDRYIEAYAKQTGYSTDELKNYVKGMQGTHLR